MRRRDAQKTIERFAQSPCEMSQRLNRRITGGLRFDTAAGLLADFLRQDGQDGSHLEESLPGLVRECAFREAIPPSHDFIIPNQKVIAGGVQLEACRVFEKICQHLIIAL